jgi:hypothetical protein
VGGLSCLTFCSFVVQCALVRVTAIAPVTRLTNESLVNIEDEGHRYGWMAFFTDCVTSLGR